jgi:hypothetical protein
MTPEQPNDPQKPNAGLPIMPAPGLRGGGAATAGGALRAPLEPALRWVKEVVAALVGLTLVGCLVYMLWSAFGVLRPQGDNDPAFDRVKDLLLFINPLVGVVIGYYFNRVSTEARAENAERTAQGATVSALQAETARGDAVTLAQQNRAEADAAKIALDDVIPAAQTLLSLVSVTPTLTEGKVGVTSAGSPAEALTEARVNLRVALERARAVTTRGAQ